MGCGDGSVGITISIELMRIRIMTRGVTLGILEVWAKAVDRAGRTFVLLGLSVVTIEYQITLWNFIR